MMLIKSLKFILIIFFQFLVGTAVHAQNKSTNKKIAKLEEKCLDDKDDNGCFRLALLFEELGYNLSIRKREVYKQRALKSFIRLCNLKGPTNKSKFPEACQRLKGGRKEIFLGINYSRTFKKYIDQCRSGALAGCYNLGLHFQESDPKRAQDLFERSCPSPSRDYIPGYVEEACNRLKGDKTPYLILYGALALIGAVAFMIANSMFKEEEEFQAGEKLEEGAKKGEEKDHGFVLRVSRPFFKRYISPIVSQMKAKKKIREKYKRKLASSGLTDYLTAEDFYSFKLFLIVGFPVTFFGLRYAMEATWPLSLVPVMGVIGFIYPDIWINGKIQQRQTEIIMAMPFSVDMLALSVEAGLDFAAAITKVVEKGKPSALLDEFNIFLKEVKIGASRAEALRNLSWRADLIQISSFCATLIAADSVGANIGPILKGLAEEIRSKRSSEIEKAGATAATKILFPMLFLIVPAVFIVVGAPIGLQLMLGN